MTAADEKLPVRSSPVAALIGATALVAIGVWVGFDAVTDIAHVASTDSEASHIWLVPILFAWLAWGRRRRLKVIPSGTRWPGTVITAMGVVLWAVGYRLQVQSAWHFGAVMIVAGGAIFAIGGNALWRFLPAWGATLFLVPIPGRVRLFIAQPLETMTAAATQSVCEVLGMAVGRSGNQLSVNGVDVCVAEACNGIRLVFTLFLAFYVAMFIRPYRNWVRVVVLIASPVVAIVANLVRLVPTLWVYGHYPPESAERFHDVAGAVMVVVAFAGLTAACGVLQWVGLPVLNPKSSRRPGHQGW